MSHCIPPRRNCAACQAEVRAAQMTEREWRRILWRFERGSPIANALLLGIVGALGHRIFRLCQSVADPITFGALLPVLWEWRWVLGTELALLVGFAWLAWWCYPRVIELDPEVDPAIWKERPEYTAANVARDRHEETLWEARVQVLKAQEEARSEMEQTQDRIEGRVRRLEDR